MRNLFVAVVLPQAIHQTLPISIARPAIPMATIGITPLMARHRWCGSPKKPPSSFLLFGVAIRVGGADKTDLRELSGVLSD
jgi:hypothetical protein